MHRRDLLKAFTAATAGVLVTDYALTRAGRRVAAPPAAPLAAAPGAAAPAAPPASVVLPVPEELGTPEPEVLRYAVPEIRPTLALRSSEERRVADLDAAAELAVSEYMEKMRNFEQAHSNDVYVTAGEERLLLAVVARLDRLQQRVGHGNFNVLGFDAMLKISGRHPDVGTFPGAELAFLEKIFGTDARELGFFGDKLMDRLTHRVPDRDVAKVKYTGHWLYRGEAMAFYERVRKDVGENLVLTSGIRGMAKQMHLFLAKAVQAEGNLSRASRSLAPPGHSYHGFGDFDVGRVGLGAGNFTSAFGRTLEFRRLMELGYVDIRYTRDNLDGVRFEPWHIKVVA